VSKTIALFAFSLATYLGLVAISLTLGTKPTVLALVAELLAMFTLGNFAVFLSVTILLTSHTVPALLAHVKLATLVALLSGTILVCMTLHSTATTVNLGTVLNTVAL